MAEKVVILIQDAGGGDAVARVRNGADAEHEFERRIEKEGWEADAVYIAERVDPAEVAKWLARYEEREASVNRSRIEERERAELERLKKKYEGA